MKMISSFVKNDNIRVIRLNTSAQRRHIYEAFGIFEGANIRIFFKNKRSVILKIGETKLALSFAAANEIFGEKDFSR